MHTSERVPSAKTLNNKADSSLDKLMLWCTEPNPENRPIDAIRALIEIEKILKANPVDQATSESESLSETMARAPLHD
jgi:hypothetical protein